MKWDNPEPGVHEAFATRTVNVALEVFETDDDEPDGMCKWWALSEGHVIGHGWAPDIAEAKRQCELVAA